MRAFIGESITVAAWGGITAIAALGGYGVLCDIRRWWRKRADVRHADRLLHDLAQVTPADMAWLAEHDLEARVLLPCAANPRLRYVSGTTERRLAEQRKRERSA